MIDQTNIHNYSIYLGEVARTGDYLFAYYEYTAGASMPTWPG